jgi:pyruvate/2-oxoglutarate dehydrogenase complex dihydrolipoamide acyltransferase (E2) component
MTDVQIPKAGMSTVEVDVLEVLVEVGEHVTADTIVVIVEGEKAQFEVAAGVDGVVEEVLVEDGQECEVGDVLLRIREQAAA